MTIQMLEFKHLNLKIYWNLNVFAGQRRLWTVANRHTTWCTKHSPIVECLEESKHPGQFLLQLVRLFESEQLFTDRFLRFITATHEQEVSFRTVSFGVIFPHLKPIHLSWKSYPGISNFKVYFLQCPAVLGILKTW